MGNKKKETSSKKEKLTSNQKDKMRNIIIIAIASILVLVGVILGIRFLLLHNEQKAYVGYEAKMNQYGLNQLYNNKSSKTSEYVTRSEALKVIIGATLNTYDISGISNDPTDTYENARWVLYAKDIGIINEYTISAKEEKQKVTYMDILEEISIAKKILLQKEQQASKEVHIKNYEKFSNKEKAAIADLIQSGIMENVDKKINGNKKVYKGMLNELIIKYVENFNLLSIDEEEMETDTTKFPSNASEYSYIVKGIDKSVYEMPFSDTKDNFKNPMKVYTEMKDYYLQYVESNDQYYNALLNIDYRTITEQSFKDAFEDCTTYALDEDEIRDYVNYVKANQIIIEGKAKTQIPIIYKTDATYRVRTKIEFEVKSGNTNQNLLFKDASMGTVTYSEKKYDIYIDSYMGQLALSNNTGINDTAIYKTLIQKNDTIQLKKGE